ncbi:hypothetical protein DVH05_023685 [Phytophthora capsici]|nr:hypothetical protein DVH05_023685 [Phytophthora capsici]
MYFPDGHTANFVSDLRVVSVDAVQTVDGHKVSDVQDQYDDGDGAGEHYGREDSGGDVQLNGEGIKNGAETVPVGSDTVEYEEHDMIDGHEDVAVDSVQDDVSQPNEYAEDVCTDTGEVAEGESH